MNYSDPKEAIVAQLAQERGKPSWYRASSPGGWRAPTYSGVGHNADPNTMQFIKRRAIPGREVHAVTFADREGSSFRYLLGVVRNRDCWQVEGLAGGGGSDPPRDQPWVNLCGWGWPNSFSGGGCVIGSGSESAARVRLRFRGGPLLEDSVDEGVVLLISDARIDMPAIADILDAGGSLLGSHSAF